MCYGQWLKSQRVKVQIIVIMGYSLTSEICILYLLPVDQHHHRKGDEMNVRARERTIGRYLQDVTPELTQ